MLHDPRAICSGTGHSVLKNAETITVFGLRYSAEALGSAVCKMMPLSQVMDLSDPGDVVQQSTGLQ